MTCSNADEERQHINMMMGFRGKKFAAGLCTANGRAFSTLKIIEGIVIQVCGGSTTGISAALAWAMQTAGPSVLKKDEEKAKGFRLQEMHDDQNLKFQSLAHFAKLTLVNTGR